MTDDPKTWLTKFLTTGTSQTDEKTRVMSKEQKDFYVLFEYLGSKDGLDLKFYQTIADIDMRVMMSYEGRRSDDVVTALSRIIQGESENVGLQPIMKKLAEQQAVANVKR
jgi:hypothetical protein